MARCIHAIRLAGTVVWFSVATCGPVATQTGDETTKYRGACDGSAAVALDADHFAVADDDHNVLRVYRIGQPDSIPSLNVDQFLEAPKEKERIQGGRHRGSGTRRRSHLLDRFAWPQL